MNPSITWDIVQNNSHLPWKYDYLSFNPNITCEIVDENPLKPWDWNNLMIKIYSKEDQQDRDKEDRDREDQQVQLDKLNKNMFQLNFID